MKEWFKRVRHCLAYLIASDWIEDLETRLSSLLCHCTGGRFSKSYYPVDTMRRAVDDYQCELCQECECFKRAEELEEKLDAAIAGQETLQNYFLSKDTPDGIRLKQNKETGEWEKFEPYMTIDCMTKEDFNAIEIAVKKQQARKPKPIPCAVDKNLFDCPYCEKTMSYKKYHHCPDCGQKLDWR